MGAGFEAYRKPGGKMVGSFLPKAMILPKRAAAASKKLADSLKDHKIKCLLSNLRVVHEPLTFSKTVLFLAFKLVAEGKMSALKGKNLTSFARDESATLSRFLDLYRDDLRFRAWRVCFNFVWHPGSFRFTCS